MSHIHLTEKDLDVDQKRVLGRIIDRWSLGTARDPYEYSGEDVVVKYARHDGLSEDQILAVIKDLEERGLIHRETVDGKVIIKYRTEASQLVKELQKTTYVNSRDVFKPPH